MEKKTGQVKGSTHWYLWSALVAIELLMSFSAFGYVHIPPLSVTIAYVPVLVAGALMGPLEAMTVGAVFGAASMWKATATYVLPFDQLFSPFFSGYPVQSVLLSVGSRMLFAWPWGCCTLWCAGGGFPVFGWGCSLFLAAPCTPFLCTAACGCFSRRPGTRPPMLWAL